jgi:hypothetical protein
LEGRREHLSARTGTVVGFFECFANCKQFGDVFTVSTKFRKEVGRAIATTAHAYATLVELEFQSVRFCALQDFRSGHASHSWLLSTSHDPTGRTWGS